uniref:Uncharacterized protein n=1 Tax=Ciona savignyi TaxID=51511 RepID=H2Z296_CIOSA
MDSRPETPKLILSPATEPEIRTTNELDLEKEVSSSMETKPDSIEEKIEILIPENEDDQTNSTADSLLQLKQTDRTPSYESVGSLASINSEDSGQACAVTMADVMTEVETTTPDPQPTMLETPPPIEPSLLKRNKTLKWSGNRKAPALIREFTRRQKRKENQSVKSPSHSAEKAPKPSPRKAREEQLQSEASDPDAHSDDS